MKNHHIKVATTTRLPTKIALLFTSANPNSANAMSAPRCGIAKAATATIKSAPHSAGDSHPGNKLKLEKATEVMSTHPKSAKMRSTSE